MPIWTRRDRLQTRGPAVSTRPRRSLAQEQVPERQEFIILGYILSTAAAGPLDCWRSAIMTIKSSFTPAGSGQVGRKSRRERCANDNNLENCVPARAPSLRFQRADGGLVFAAVKFSAMRRKWRLLQSWRIMRVYFRTPDGCSGWPRGSKVGWRNSECYGQPDAPRESQRIDVLWSYPGGSGNWTRDRAR